MPETEIDEKDRLMNELHSNKCQTAYLEGQITGMWEMLECLYGKKRPASRGVLHYRNE